MIDTSILIVSKNRKDELKKTLTILRGLLDEEKHEVCVFLDGCTDGSEALKTEFAWVLWSGSEKSLGASKARYLLYKAARGVVFIGLDDDSHPLHPDFVEHVRSLFEVNPTVGVLAFQEVRGLFASDADAIAAARADEPSRYSAEFVGCGFAILKSVYRSTRGFPVWMDIYGEEACVSIEVLAQQYDILYVPSIMVNHRVDKVARAQEKRNYFRFEKQLLNHVKYYMVYYNNPMFDLLKLFRHNFLKYALKDIRYFYLFNKVLLQSVLELPLMLKYRQPVPKAIIAKRKQLKQV